MSVNRYRDSKRRHQTLNLMNFLATLITLKLTLPGFTNTPEIDRFIRMWG